MKKIVVLFASLVVFGACGGQPAKKAESKNNSAKTETKEIEGFWVETNILETSAEIVENKDFKEIETLDKTSGSARSSRKVVDDFLTKWTKPHELSSLDAQTSPSLYGIWQFKNHGTFEEYEVNGFFSKSSDISGTYKLDKSKKIDMVYKKEMQIDFDRTTFEGKEVEHKMNSRLVPYFINSKKIYTISLQKDTSKGIVGVYTKISDSDGKKLAKAVKKFDAKEWKKQISSTSSSSSSVPAPAPAPAPTVPDDYQNALKKAASYSKLMHMSKAGIYKQLTSEYGEKFSPEAGQYAIDNLKVDWNNNALEKAKTYQKDMNMSPEAIRQQLTSEYGEEFTPEEAEYAIQHLGN